MVNLDRPLGRHAAYLSDHSAAAGAEDLFEQMQEIERFAVGQWALPDLRLFVDSGHFNCGSAFAPALQRLIDEVCAGSITTIVIKRYSVLAPSRTAARRAVRALIASGAQLHVLSKVDRRVAMTLPRDPSL